MEFKIRFRGVCTRYVEFCMGEDLIVSNVRFFGGCPGNTSGVAKLSEGMHADRIIEALSGVCCETKNTSCPDQFAKALMACKAEVMTKENELVENKA